MEFPEELSAKDIALIKNEKAIKIVAAIFSW